MTLLEWIDKKPPIFCRLVARKNRGRAQLTCREIADLSKISEREIDRLSSRTSWRGIRIETASAFAAACGVDLFSPSRQFEWFRRRKHAAWAKNGRVARRLLTILAERTSPSNSP